MAVVLEEKGSGHSVWEVLTYLHQQGSAPRSQIARELELSKASVTEAIRYLDAKGLVVPRKAIANGSGRGRQTIPIQVNPEAGLLLGVDQAGGSLMVVVLDMALKVQARFEFPQLPRRAETSETLVFDAVDAVLMGLGPDRAAVRAIGVAIPGLVVVPEGIVAYSSPFGWKDEPLKKTFETRYNLPTIVVNDVNAMLVSEVIGTPLVNSTVMLLYIGEGIGGALWTNHRLWSGSHFSSGEWGHTKVRENGRLCQCGGRGCLEAEYSLPAVVRRVGLRDAHLNSWTAMVDHQNDDIVVRELGDLSEAVGQVVGSAVAFIDPEVVIIDGPVTVIPALVQQIALAIRRGAFAYSMDRIAFRAGSQGKGATACGAASVAAEAYLGHRIQILNH